MSTPRDVCAKLQSQSAAATSEHEKWLAVEIAFEVCEKIQHIVFVLFLSSASFCGRRNRMGLQLCYDEDELILLGGITFVLLVKIVKEGSPLVVEFSAVESQRLFPELPVVDFSTTLFFATCC